jgi:hypothetical protein
MSSSKIKAFIVNRNLVTTLINTVDFLLKEPRVEVVIFDQNSNYPPLIEYYKNCGVRVINSPSNNGPHSVWGLREFNNQPFIVTDSDCDYQTVPDNWLDKMLFTLNNSEHFKVGFSLEIDNLPSFEIANQAIIHESKYWKDKDEFGWVSDVDTTFALYRPNSPFSYKALRLDKPYTIKHTPWYLTCENLNDEWIYYLKNSSGVSTWGSKLKNLCNLEE